MLRLIQRLFAYVFYYACGECGARNPDSCFDGWPACKECQNAPFEMRENPECRRTGAETRTK